MIAGAVGAAPAATLMVSRRRARPAFLADPSRAGGRDAVEGVARSGLRPALAWAQMARLLQSPRPDPGRFALKAAARTALVMPSVFAFAMFVIDDPQTALFAGFGSFAALVLADFGGPRKARFLAHGGLALAGVVLIVIGTLCSHDPWLAAAATLVVTFAILFAGVLNGWLAAGANAAVVAFVLPVTLAVPYGQIPERLLGWLIASVAATAAQLLLWPARPRDRVQTAARDALRALADVVDPRTGAATAAPAAGTPAAPAPAPAPAAAPVPAAPPAPDLDARLAAADAALAELRRRELAGPYRPAGSTGAAAGLALLTDELVWLRRTLTPVSGEPSPPPGGGEAETLATVAAVLRAGADALDGTGEGPDLVHLHAVRAAQRERLAEAVTALGPVAADHPPTPVVREQFRRYAAARSAARVGAAALRAAGRSAPPPTEFIAATERLAAEHASTRSVWFRNSARGAVALAISVWVARQAELQEAFWVVLGTLSVLRSSALGTGTTVLDALLGTAVGIVAGAIVVTVVPTGSAVLWALLPFAVLLAAYAPRVATFAAGQAGFTLLLVILFNLLRPIGWTVGVVRVEDVAIGFAISLALGLLFWPRGAAALLRTSLQSAYGAAGELLAAARRLLADLDAADADGVATVADGRAVEAAARSAQAAADRLDDAYRQYLAERPVGEVPVADVATLVEGAQRVRRTARALLDGRAAAAPLAPPQRACFARIWGGLYLEELGRLEQRLAEPAAALQLQLPPLRAEPLSPPAPPAAPRQPRQPRQPRPVSAPRRVLSASRISRRGRRRP